jgi:hypothetical protein
MKNVVRGKQLASALLTLFVVCSLWQDCLAAPRREVKIPDIPGYKTLKCDFHMHTVFSDGQVWPTVRVEEAWREGLDAIAITDHIEYKAHKTDVRPDDNRSYEIARPAAADKGIILIKGVEITKDMPPGHFNAIFIKDAKPLDSNDFNVVMKNAAEQGAFVTWNHPGWDGQQPDGVPRWYAEHTKALENGWMKGIEVVNDNEYYPLVFTWALEKKLTIMGNSDVHDPMCLSCDFCKGEHRPMTLVFAKEATEDSIKEALLARRTAVYYGNKLIGEEQYLKQIFDKSVEILQPQVSIRGNGSAVIRIHNSSEIDFDLVANGSPEFVKAPGNITLTADRTVLLTIKAKDKAPGTEKIRIPYKVKNLLVAPNEGLKTELAITVNFVPAE